MTTELGLDLRTVVRRLRRAPISTGILVATLALGIGVNTAVFSVLRESILRSWPCPQAERIVSIWDAKSLSKRSLERILSARSCGHQDDG